MCVCRCMCVDVLHMCVFTNWMCGAVVKLKFNFSVYASLGVLC